MYTDLSQAHKIRICFFSDVKLSDELQLTSAWTWSLLGRSQDSAEEFADSSKIELQPFPFVEEAMQEYLLKAKNIDPITF